MADILLTVGADYSASIKEFESSINSIVAQLNKDIGNRKIKIGLEIDNTQLKNLNKQIKSIQNSSGNIGSLGSSGSTTVINGIATGAKNATSDLNKMGLSIADVNAKLKMLNMDTSDLTKSYKGILKNKTAYPVDGIMTLTSSLEKLYSMTSKLSMSKIDVTDSDISEIRQVQSAIHGVVDALTSLYDVDKNKAELKFIKSDTAALTSTYKKINSNASTYDAEQLQKLKDTMIELQVMQDKISKAPEIVSDADLDRIRQQQNMVRELLSGFDLPVSTLDETKVLSDYNSALGRGEKALRDYTAAKNSAKESSRVAYGAIENEVNALRNCHNAYREATGEKERAQALEALNKQAGVVNKTLEENVRIMKNDGTATKAFSDRVEGLAGKFTSWLTISQAIMLVVRQLKQMVTNVIELDTAMTELKKVTDETDAAYANFLENAALRSKGTGATLTDTVNATADFARLGYDIGEAEELADAAIVYKNVGDGIDDIGTASESIISTMQAFDIGAENAMNIVDKFNEVGNNFAISSDGIGESLLRSAAALNAANNTLDESIALTTAANTVVQNPEKVGTTLKTVSMYLRAAKTEAEDAGESTEGMAGSVSELREELLQLTGGRVDIQIDENNFKSTYQILKELASVWDSLSDITQANITEMVGGKRNSNVVTALLENFDVAEEVLATSTNAAGSALAENDKYLDSIQGRISILKATFQELSANVVDSDLIKFVVSFGTSLLEVANGVTTLGNAFGGIINAAIALGGALSIIKFDSFMGILSKVSGALTGVSKNIQTIAGSIFLETLSSLNLNGRQVLYKYAIEPFVKLPAILKEIRNPALEVGEGMTRLDAAMKNVGTSATALKGAIGIATTAITLTVAAVSAVVYAYNSHKQRQEEQRQAAIESGQAAANEANELLSLYEAYIEADNAYSQTTGSKAELTDATNSLLDALGAEGNSIDELVGKYGTLGAAMQSLMLTDLRGKTGETVAAYQAAAEGLESSVGGLLGLFPKVWTNGGEGAFSNYGETQGVSASNSSGSLRIHEYWSDAGANVTMQLPVYLVDFMEEQGWEKFIDGNDLKFDTSSAEGIAEAYDILTELRNWMADRNYTEENPWFDVFTAIIESIRPSYDEYAENKNNQNRLAAKIDLLEYFSTNELPTTEDELSGIVDEMIGSNDSLVGAPEEIKQAYTDALSEIAAIYPELADIIDSATTSISSNLSTVTNSTKTTVDGIQSVISALKEQEPGKSIDIETFNSEELEDYTGALEYSNGSMQLNADAVREIIAAKAEEQKEIIRTNKALEQDKYIENARKIEQLTRELANYSDGSDESVDDIQAQIDALQDENDQISSTCKQYDLLTSALDEATSAYQHWQNAQNASDYGDMADDSISAIQRINDTFDEESELYGQFGSKKFDAAVEFIIPDTIDPNDTAAIEEYMNNLQSYLYFDDDGSATGLNLNKFIQDAANAGLMTIDEASGEYALAGEVFVEDFVKGLNMSSGMVQAFFDELQLYGGEFEWGTTTNTVLAWEDEMNNSAIAAYDAAKMLKRFPENSELNITIDVSDINDKEEKINTLKSTVREMDDIKSRVDVDASRVEEANDVIDYCIRQIQDLSQPEVLHIDATRLDDDIGNAIYLLQQFKLENNNLEVQIATGADTSETESKIKTIADQIRLLPTEFITKLGIDTTSEEALLESINNITQQQLINIGVNTTAIDNYEAPQLTGTVVYEGDLSNLPKEAPYIKGTAYYYSVFRPVGSENLFENQLPFVTEGNASVAGTVNKSGRAYASGDWGTAPGGRTLVGELGREIVVNPRTGKWYTVGDNGAEFVNIPSGSIVFNHLQTEDLLSNGYVSGRAMALTGGTALAGGSTVSGGGKLPTQSGTTSNSSTNNTSTTNTNSKKQSTETEEDDSEIIDWIEIAINRIERAIERAASIAGSPFRILSDRLGATDEQIAKTTEEISLQNKAYNRYMQQANSVGLSEDLAQKVRNGTIDIVEYDGDTAEKIKDYQEWYEKALDCNDAIQELNDSLAELYESRFDNIATDYENQLSMIEHLVTSYENGADELEEYGYLTSTKFYEALQETNNEEIRLLNEQLASLTEQLDKAVDSGTIKEGSESWYEMKQQINEVTEAIQEANVEAASLVNSIREAKWERFDYLQDYISDLTEEANFLIDLMDIQELYTDNGQPTEYGLSTMGLHGQNYNVAMRQADLYADEISKINDELANDPNNTKLIDRKLELVEAQREAISAAESEKDAIVDMVREGIELELDALQELIDKYNESMDSAKDLYDYQNNIREQTEEIATLQKQLSAYAGDTSEENRAVIQRIEADLKEAEENLDETQYERYISEQQKLLDELYSEYEMILNQRLDNVDALISDMISEINSGATTINDTIQGAASSVGYTISTGMSQIWSNLSELVNILSPYKEDNLQGDITGDGKITKEDASEALRAAVHLGTLTDEQKAKVDMNGDGKFTTADARLILRLVSSLDMTVDDIISFIENLGENSDAWADKLIDAIQEKENEQGSYKRYASGGLVDRTGFAYLDGTPSNPEMVLNAADTSNFIALKDALASVAKNGGTIGDLFSGEYGSAQVLSSLANISIPRQLSRIGNVEVNYRVSIPIDHVQDYNDFMNQMQRDGKFERMIQSMTIDRLVGGSKIAKNRYEW